MSTIDNGGAAFPVVHPDGQVVQYLGLSVREYLAAKAMQGWLASYAPHEKPEPQDVAAFAYQVADAMISARDS